MGSRAEVKMSVSHPAFQNTSLYRCIQVRKWLFAMHANFYIEGVMVQISLWFPFYSWSGNKLVICVVYTEPHVWALLLFVITANRCSRMSQGQQRRRRWSSDKLKETHRCLLTASLLKETLKWWLNAVVLKMLPECVTMVAVMHLGFLSRVFKGAVVGCS